MQYPNSAAPAANRSDSYPAGYAVRRPSIAEYFLGDRAFIVTKPSGQSETVTWRPTAVGTVWNQRGGHLQEICGAVQLSAGPVDCILAAMAFLAAEFAAQNPAPTPIAPAQAPFVEAPFVEAPFVVTMLLIPVPVAPAFASTVPASLAPRADFCDRFPHRKPAYLEAQKEMFKMARDKGLDTEERTAMIECLCALLNINISSRRQLTPEEMIRATRAFAAGAVLPGWELEDAEMLLAA